MSYKFIDVWYTDTPSQIPDPMSTQATITAITQANPASVTATAHGFATGDLVVITGVSGMTQVNNTQFTITVVNANTFTLGVDSTGFTAYTSGGTATKNMIPIATSKQVRIIYDDAMNYGHIVDATIRGTEDLVEFFSRSLPFGRA